MNETEKYNELLNQAKLWHANGFDERYIELQLAEKGVDDAAIDKIVAEIKKMQKADKKGGGTKFTIYGLSFIAVGFGLTAWTFHWESPFRFVLWGVIAAGVGFLVKGIGRMLGL